MANSGISKEFLKDKGYENKRDLKDIPKEELKNEEYLNNWCGSRTDHKSNSRGFSGVKINLGKSSQGVARTLPKSKFFKLKILRKS